MATRIFDDRRERGKAAMTRPHDTRRKSHRRSRSPAGPRVGVKKRRTSLLAEIDPVLQKQCAAILEQAGFDVETRNSGIDAVVAARELRPDIIVLGGQLRDVPAREAIGWLKANAELRSTPILVLDGTPTGDANGVMDIGVALLQRPFTPLRIQRAIAAASRTFEPLKEGPGTIHLVR
jgi:DNA-binding response OmpR family regulator